MKNLKKTFKNKTIIVTGHTGFKGSWLTFWLKKLGAKVVGVSSDYITKPSNFEALGLKKQILHKKLDIRNLKKVSKLFKTLNPDFVFHLAAQSLVKKSYNNPIETITTNSIGTLNILESLRFVKKKKCIVILITSDKSYKNMEIKRGYKENDILGGHDPYSASKAGAELIIQSYINSYFNNKKNKVSIGVARAGNVIGGGDWSPDRLVPDCVKSWSKKKKVIIRNPRSTRPWQHVFEALGGYLLFAAKLRNNSNLHGEVFNFGPANNKTYNVLKLVKKMREHWKIVSWHIKKINTKQHESNLLKLNCSKARIKLKWKSILNFNETIEISTKWYKKYYTNPKKIREYSYEQICYYEKLLKERL